MRDFVIPRGSLGPGCLASDSDPLRGGAFNPYGGV